MVNVRSPLIAIKLRKIVSRVIQSVQLAYRGDGVGGVTMNIDVSFADGQSTRYGRKGPL
jgi:hypothetical protein